MHRVVVAGGVRRVRAGVCVVGQVRRMTDVATAVTRASPDETQHDRRQREQKPERKTGEKEGFHIGLIWLVVGVLRVPKGVNEAT